MVPVYYGHATAAAMCAPQRQWGGEGWRHRGPGAMMMMTFARIEIHHHFYIGTDNDDGRQLRGGYRRV
uniref:Uncharacterized protein n=1 Tax=Oryza meridionalis TaxID=40149 RepID=A0A0E0E5I8_9ORYZ